MRKSGKRNFRTIVSNSTLFSRSSGSINYSAFSKKKRRGRSLTARELLEDYSSIIDAIDTVSDDALKRGVDITEGTVAVTEAERRFLAQLQKIEDRNLADVDLYEVALKEAIASTSDSMDLAKEDAGVARRKIERGRQEGEGRG